MEEEHFVLDKGMRSTDRCIAVIDLGKTNKKISIYSEKLELLEAQVVNIGEIEIDGFLSDDIAVIEKWMISTLKTLFKKYSIKVISITTFGASLVFLDAKGCRVFPVISYNQQLPDKVAESFFQKYGDEYDIYRDTATPRFSGLLNVGIQIHFLQTAFPEQFSKVKAALFLPQYIGRILTGENAVERTMPACHSYLLDFKTMNWSEPAICSGTAELFPDKFSMPWDILGYIDENISGTGNKCPVTVGLHDSSASLLPYISNSSSDFILASTGTCCVFMHPEDNYELTESDIQHNVIYYLDPTGIPVKSVDFMGGSELDFYYRKIEKAYNINPWEMKLNSSLVKEIISDAESFIMPSVVSGYGIFANSESCIMGAVFSRDAEYAVHCVAISLAAQAAIAINSFSRIPEQIFIEGGFGKNAIFLNALKHFITASKISVSAINEATSIGAAICGQCVLYGKAPRELDHFKMELREIVGDNCNISDDYLQKFKKLCLKK